MIPKQKKYMSKVTRESAMAWECPSCKFPLLETKPGTLQCFTSTCNKQFAKPEAK